MTSAALDVGQAATQLQDDLYKSQDIIATITSNRKGAVDADTLARRWSIGKEAAKRTIERTTQTTVRDFTTQKPYSYQLKHPRLNVEMYTDTLIGKSTSLQGNKYAQIYCPPFGWVTVMPIKRKSDAHYTLDELFRKVGFPKVLIPDNAKEMTLGQYRKKCLRAQVPIHSIEAYTPNQNLAERAIRELKRMYRRTMIETQAPACLWDLCLVYQSLIRRHTSLNIRHTSLNIRELQGDVPQTVITGDPSDISFIAEIAWYDYVWFL